MFFLATCARIRWSHLAFESTLNSSIVSYHIVSYNWICYVCFLTTEAENQLIKLADVITICPGSGTTSESQSARSNIELVPVGTATSFSIYYIRRVSGHKLRHCRVVFDSNDAGIVSEWVDRVREVLALPGSEHLCIIVSREIIK